MGVTFEHYDLRGMTRDGDVRSSRCFSVATTIMAAPSSEPALIKDHTAAIGDESSSVRAHRFEFFYSRFHSRFAPAFAPDSRFNSISLHHIRSGRIAHSSTGTSFTVSCHRTLSLSPRPFKAKTEASAEASPRLRLPRGAHPTQQRPDAHLSLISGPEESPSEFKGLAGPAAEKLPNFAQHARTNPSRTGFPCGGPPCRSLLPPVLEVPLQRSTGATDGHS